jgi:hypothetical protein
MTINNFASKFLTEIVPQREKCIVFVRLMLKDYLFSMLPASNPNQSAGVQPYTSVQSPQATTGSVINGHVVPQTRTQFSWFNTLVGAGVFLGFGASSVIIIKVYHVFRKFSRFCGRHEGLTLFACVFCTEIVPSKAKILDP